MAGISLNVLLLFVAAVISQLIAAGLLPRTAGFTNPVPTLACAGALVLSFLFIARMIHSGVNLSILAPLVSAIVPLGAVFIGILMYGEAASIGKVALLITACALIGVAARAG